MATMAGITWLYRLRPTGLFMEGTEKMQNQQIYQRDPSTRKLINEGVASVNDLNEEVLRYELETFVCDGQYQKWM